MSESDLVMLNNFVRQVLVLSEEFLSSVNAKNTKFSNNSIANIQATI